MLALQLAKAQVNNDSLRSVEINGKKQYYQIKGKGEPSVIIVSGLGTPMSELSDLQNRISKTARVLCYDRAGLGRSEVIDSERSLDNICSELKQLLEKTGMDKPCVFAGHSRGGSVLRYYVNKYPENVLGLLLIDPSVPELRAKKRELRTEEEKTQMDNFYRSFYSDTAKFPEIFKRESKSTNTTDTMYLRGKSFPVNIPITIIASVQITKEKYSKQDNAIKTALLEDYKKKTPQLKLVFTKRSGHFIHEEEPGLVMKEMKLLMDKVKAEKK
jgi:pimeloyl-ACP methyl ester carboxylesterase